MLPTDGESGSQSLIPVSAPHGWTLGFTPALLCKEVLGTSARHLLGICLQSVWGPLNLFALECWLHCFQGQLQGLVVCVLHGSSCQGPVPGHLAVLANFIFGRVFQR